MAIILSQTIHARIQHIFNTGVQQSANKEEARRIRVVNIVSFATGILVTVYGIAFYLLLHSLYILLPAVFVFCPAFFSMIWLNGHKHYNASRIGIHAIFIAIILYYGSILGKVTEVQLLAVFLMSVALLIWRPQEKVPRFICAAMPIVCLIVLEFIYYFKLIEPLPLSHMTQNIYRWMVMPVVLYLNFLAISLYQQNIMDLLRTLRSRNTSLIRSRNQNERQRKQLELYSQQLEKLVDDRTAALVKANMAKTEFISELSHELRTPLNAIIGISDMLSHTLSQKDADPQARKMVKSMNATSHNILEVLNHVLDLARMEAGKSEEVKPETFSLREHLHNIVSIYQSIASTNLVVVHLEVDARFPELIVTDRVMLTQIINNILSNSLKFTPSAKNIRVRCFDNGTNLFIQICDEGIGISQQQLDAIFLPFEQADREVYRQYGGSGLGLAIAKRKAELLGGSIQVSSIVGEGSNFLIAVPLIESKGSVDEQIGEELALLPADTKIVVMDDSEIDHTIMRHFLHRIGIVKVGFAKNGLEGIALVRSMRPDVILMDLHMPVMDGREAFCLLRKDEQLRHIPVIAVSSDAFKEQEEGYMLMGMDGYLRKPVESRVLHGVLKRLLLYETKHVHASIAVSETLQWK